MAGDIGLLGGAWATAMGAELASITALSGVLQTGTAFDNTAALGTGLMFWGDFELNITFAASPTAKKPVDIYIIPLSSAGGSTYTDAITTLPPDNLYVGSFSVRATTAAQILALPRIVLPPQQFIVLLVNGADQAFSSLTTMRLKLFPYQVSYS